MAKIDEMVQQALAQPGAMNIAQPLNDTQLVCLVAAQASEMPPAEAVDWAVEVVIEAIAQMGSGRFNKRLQARLQQEQAHKGNGIIHG